MGKGPPPYDSRHRIRNLLFRPKTGCYCFLRPCSRQCERVFHAFPAQFDCIKAEGKSRLFAWQAKAVPGRPTRERRRRRSPSRSIGNTFWRRRKEGSGGQVRADGFGKTRPVWKQLSEAALSQRGISGPGLGPSGCALQAPGEKALGRAITCFERRGTKWRHNTSQVDPARRKISLGCLGLFWRCH